MAIADIKKFNGFIAPDGSYHETQAKAVTYTKDLKAKEALKAFAQNRVVDDDLADKSEALDAFLFENKEAILACFNQEVKLRAPPRKSPKKAAPSVAYYEERDPTVSPTTHEAAE